ncbi:hypothetical protein [Flammeovirga sp. SubArs3]|uniref:hypothetical protein n=1 Tax=Flammeovirga sp. SubArs3 TaxID=2995316 RepID=UPI00248CBCBB|nr:hypothetical protein [Flammeovirga sp. SubArs3]
MKLAELIIGGEPYEVVIFPENAPIATERFEALVKSNIFNGWKVKFVVPDRLIKFEPFKDTVHFTERPMTRPDHSAPKLRQGVLAFVGVNKEMVSDRLMFVLNDEDAATYDGICSPIGCLTVDHQKKVSQVDEGMIISKISIKEVEKEEILSRIPSFI